MMVGGPDRIRTGDL